jgi:putative ABC transport system permease protein
VWRAVAATTAAAAVLAVCTAFVASAVTLTQSPVRYGFDADLLAVNPYGDQAESALHDAFGSSDEVDAATGFTAGPFLVDGRAVPGLAATNVKAEITPTLLRGRPPRAEGEIVLGRDTMDSIGADVGDVVPVRLQVGDTLRPGEPTSDEADLRIVGVATFPAVNQIGTDMPRLGIGALVTRDAFLRIGGNAANEPEFTAVRLADGADATTVIAENRDGFKDAAQSTTSWFTDAKPAELRQLDVAMPYLRAGFFVGFLVLLGVVVHALWTRVLASRHDLAVLRAVGSTGAQVDAVTAWQAAPFALGALLLGVPVGIALGRRAFTLFAQSLAVVDDASMPASTLVVLLIAVLLAVVVAGLAGIAVARRSGTAAALRAD